MKTFNDEQQGATRYRAFSKLDDRRVCSLHITLLCHRDAVEATAVLIPDVLIPMMPLLCCDALLYSRCTANKARALLFAARTHTYGRTRGGGCENSGLPVFKLLLANHLIFVALLLSVLYLDWIYPHV